MADAKAGLERPVLLDNTVLTNLALVGQIGLVKRLWPVAACTTSQVLDEYELGAASGLLPSDAWSDLAIATLTEEETRFAAGLSVRLGAGERSCLAIAVHRHGLLASDDLDARHAAQELGIPTTGTVGILVLCVHRGYLSQEEANALLAEMIRLGYRSPVDSLDPLLEEP
jgi:predicted nucleic acid-binding protein